LSKVGDVVQVITPKGDGSNDSRVEQLSSELKQLKLQRKIDKLKKKIKESKSHEVVSSSSSNKEAGASSEEEAKDKKRGKEDKRSYNTTPFNYDNLPHLTPSLRYPLVDSPFQWDGLYQMELHDEDASNLARSHD
jgi:hypothetical protein